MSNVSKIKGVALATRKQRFLDELSAQLQTERAGVKLYASQGLQSKPLDKAGCGPSAQDLLEIQNAHQAEVSRLEQILRDLGANPNRVSPLAQVLKDDLACTVQVVSNVNTDLYQALRVTLGFEGMSAMGWDVLAEVAEEAGYPQYRDEFQKYEDIEQEHVESVREWVSELNTGSDC